ncbi:phosphoribosylaminoimidazole-succinocarboxamide synthase [Salmonella sp. NCTC 11881]|nr:phosphoribosylaminoimidazole-succinocarboxamide synthase [Salmonella sp. NCTC 11881]
MTRVLSWWIFKLEFGLYKGEVVLGDEFSPDGSRLWDKETLDKMDKDRLPPEPGRSD